MNKKLVYLSCIVINLLLPLVAMGNNLVSVRLPEFEITINDVEMLEFVAHGIAMGNGTDVAKNAAEFVTTDIHKDGIWNGLKHYGLI